MIDGVGSKPFSATNMAPLPRKSITYRNEVIENSRAMYAHTRDEVQGGVDQWHKKIFETAKDKKEREKREVYLAEKAEKAEKEKLMGVSEKDPVKAAAKIVIPQEIVKRVEQSQNINQNNFKRNQPDNSYPKINKEQRPTQSLNKLVSNKNPSDKNKNLLKDVLSKALQKENPSDNKTNQTETNTKISTENPKPQQEFKKPEHVQNVKKEETVANKKPREIPEDILKQILE
jgi:hypothetical protein